jgi:integrase
MLHLVRVGLGDITLKEADVRLDRITKRLLRDYQDKERARYEAEATATAGENNEEKERRMARDRADRTTKSTFNQAKSIFSRKRELVDRYRDAGIVVPDCVKEFAATSATGKMSTKRYFPPSDEMMKETFLKIEELRNVDPEAYCLFWTALGTGCRRNELADMRIEDLVELNGRLWVGAGLGKDGEQIQIPVISSPVHPANARTPASVIQEARLERATASGTSAYLFLGDKTERYDTMPDRLNAWLKRMGWLDEKKLHGLRAYIGCKLYVKNPRLAQAYLRHKSIATTEKFYAGFLRLHGAFNFEDDTEPAMAVLTPAAVN